MNAIENHIANLKAMAEIFSEKEKQSNQMWENLPKPLRDKHLYMAMAYSHAAEEVKNAVEQFEAALSENTEAKDVEE